MFQHCPVTSDLWVDFQWLIRSTYIKTAQTLRHQWISPSDMQSLFLCSTKLDPCIVDAQCQSEHPTIRLINTSRTFANLNFRSALRIYYVLLLFSFFKAESSSTSELNRAKRPKQNAEPKLASFNKFAIYNRRGFGTVRERFPTYLTNWAYIELPKSH